ncbi:MAG: hypothetical protein JO219_08755 [Candidatus Eremiobacteraeota bacterium]|nr:hypothetical protein [Candidatus Eremiobacteraeota bacterium]
MTGAPGVVAHMIVGRRAELYLADALASIADVCTHAVINDNSGDADGSNTTIIGASAFARSGRLTHLRTTFVDFSTARNACIDATPPEFAGGWALFADADEVHGGELAHMAALLGRLPADADALDGYSRNFIGSFDYWNTLHRRLRFFRLAHGRRWEGGVHERLAPLGRRVAVPAVGAHYGHVCTPRDEVERERLYKSLGQQVTLLDKASLEQITPQLVWGEQLRDALPFRGSHPAAARATIARLRAQWADTFADVARIVAQQSLADKIRNRARAANYAQTIWFRNLDASLRLGFTAKA